VVAGPRGRRWHRRGHRGEGRWCGACGGEAVGGRWPEMAAHMEALMKEPAARRRAVPGAPCGGVEGVLERRRWHQRGVPTAAACEGNKILRSDSGQKADPGFVVTSISTGSIWNRC
jgi:hypothetical protein